MHRHRAKIILLSFGFSLALLGGGCVKQPASVSDGASVTAPASEEESVRKELDAFFHAVDVKDWTKVEGLLAQDFEFYTDESLVLSRDEFIKAMRDDNMKIEKFELKDVKINLSRDSQMAWIKYHAFLESEIRGEPFNMKSAETVAMRKEGSQWKLTHNHASVKKLTNTKSTS